MIVSRGDVASPVFELPPVDGGLEGNWASIAENLGDMIMSARADMDDNANGCRNVGREGAAKLFNRLNRPRRPADGYDPVHIGPRKGAQNENRWAGHG